MKPGGSRLKGAAYEREVKKMFEDLFPGTQRLGWAQRFTRQMPDVQSGPFAIEVKIGERPNPLKALLQSSRTAPKGLIPLAICKRDRCRPTVTLWAEDFLDMVKEWKERGE